MILRWWRYALFVVLAGGLLVAALAALIFSLIYPQLPSLEILTDYRPKIPLRIYTADGALIGEFGEERRALIKIQDVPNTMRQAILAAEDLVDDLGRKAGDEPLLDLGDVDLLRIAVAEVINRQQTNLSHQFGMDECETGSDGVGNYEYSGKQ